jgi:DNA-binding response OmpR family regulator
VRDHPTLLCLNDEQTALFVRKLVLEKEGFEVLTSTTANDALKLMSERPVDLVIADHLLSDTTGGEIEKEIKRRWPGTPVVLLSGMIERPEDTDAVDAFVSKVDGREALISTIWRLLDSKHSRR